MNKRKLVIGIIIALFVLILGASAYVSYRQGKIQSSADVPTGALGYGYGYGRSLILHYDFTRGYFTDWSGNNYHGALSGFLDGLEFNSSQRKVVVPWTEQNIFSFERNQPFSLMAYFKTTSSHVAILGKMVGKSPNRGYDIYIDREGRIAAQIINHWESGNAISVLSTTKVNDGKIHAVVITYDGSSEASGLKIYIDKKIENTSISADNLNGTIKNQAPFMVGGRYGESYFTGNIAIIKVWNQALTQDEVNKE